MDAYNLSHAASLAGTGADTALQPVPVAPVAGDGHDLQLVTARVEIDSIRAGELKQALLDAGASTIVVSEAQLNTRETEEQVVRGERRSIDLPSRLRVEVVVPQAQVSAVLEALDRFSSGPRGGFVQSVAPTPLLPV